MKNVNFSKISTVITHDGIFHADEVTAVALIKMFNPEIQIVRSRDKNIIALGKGEATTIVLDTGGEFNFEKLNFDHHQDLSLRSSAGLIWENFRNEIFQSQGITEQAQIDYMFSKINPFICAIDDWDTNGNGVIQLWKQIPKELKNFNHYSLIIASFNRNMTDATEQMSQFMTAVNFATEMLNNQFYSANKAFEAEKNWENREMLSPKVAYFPVYCSVWKEKKSEEPELAFSITPNPQGFSIDSKDSEAFPLPTAEEIKTLIGEDSLVFCHAGRFKAIVKDEESYKKIANVL